MSVQIRFYPSSINNKYRFTVRKLFKVICPLFVFSGDAGEQGDGEREP